MGKLLRCRDVGVDCDFEVHAETEDEIMEKCAEHVKKVYNMTNIPPELAAKAKSVIKDV
jgi:predicted small metal-binding protein